MSKIQIVSACDDNYVQHLAVMLCSLLENTENSKNISINIIDGGISQNNRQIINDFFQKKYSTKIDYVNINPNIYSNFPISHHFTHTIYYRISIPLLFDNSIDKVIYLDSDMVIEDDINKLWQVNIDNYFLAAVEALSFKDRYQDLQIPEGSLYFCSGVLIINLQQWRNHQITEKVINFIVQNRDKIICWDQDSLNAITYNNWLPLPLKWNQQSYFFEQKFYSQHSNREDFIEALEQPSIIHYSSSYKPWDYINFHPYRQTYYDYLSLTPWKNFQPKFNFYCDTKRMIKKYLFFQF
jgi:lipopolysaccharide biosynthesis glycosyltransferase